MFAHRFSILSWLRMSLAEKRVDRRSVDRDQAEAMLAAIGQVLPSCEEEIRERLPELKGRALEAEAFRLALRKLGLRLPYQTYRYLQCRWEERESSSSTMKPLDLDRS